VYQKEWIVTQDLGAPQIDLEKLGLENNPDCATAEIGKHFKILLQV